MRRAIFLVSLLLLTGCHQGVWVKPGATQQNFDMDKYACMQEAMQGAPVTPGVEGYDVYNKHDHQVEGQVTTTDMNAANRDQLQTACLQARGWSFQLVK